VHHLTVRAVLILAVLCSCRRRAQGYTHEPCTRALRAQLQFPDCYLPALNEELLLSEASFLLSHNAATGYIHRNSLSKTGLSWRYSQNQIGTVYDQLQDGARALDVRPFLYRNGTVVMQHGAIRIPVTLELLLADAIRWCHENPDELVILLPSHFAYEDSSSTYRFRKSNNNGDDDDGSSYYYDDEDEDDDDTQLDMVSAIADVLNRLGVPYYDCTSVYELTVSEAMQLATLGDNQGYLLVLDGHDYYGTSCGKENWIESQAVTCYPNNTMAACTKSDESWQALRDYMLASANNEATDDSSVLGPPANLYNKPFNEIQALWQVDTASAVAGLSHLSSILQDNRQSRLNELVMNMVYEGQFDAISLLAVDNVATYGNALTSVLRNQCGQSTEDRCGAQLEKPKLVYWHVSARQWIVLVAALYAVWFIYSVTVLKRPKLLYTAFARCSERWVPRRRTCALDARQEELLPDGRPG